MNDLREFVAAHPRLAMLTGAGLSTSAGIPDYRDADGAWKRAKPVEFRPFMTDPNVRQRYWARSTMGWPLMRRARPSAAHHAIARLEELGIARMVITQNVDGLHTSAGNHAVIDLHGRLDHVRCMCCGRYEPRSVFQQALLERNPAWADVEGRVAPDGDYDIEGRAFADFAVPDCAACGGILKPDVVFFGENVPRERVERAFAAIERADALLVAGSSLMVYSGYRFAAAAAAAGKPIAAVNLGRTRADSLFALKVTRACDEVLPALVTP